MTTWGKVLDLIEENKQRIGAEAYDVVRNHYIEKLAEHTENDTVVYTTGWSSGQRPGANYSIDDQDVEGFMEAFSGLNGNSLDLVLHSPGGSPETAEQIVEYIRSKYSNFRVFVPQAARSAATLMTTAADEVVMGTHSSLGPIDPQLPLQTELGYRLVPAHSVLNQFDNAREEFKSTGEIGHWGPILRQYGPSLLVECEDAINYSEELASQWSYEYMFDGENKSQADELSTRLAERAEHKSHNRPIMRDEAREIGFNVFNLESDQTLQDYVLAVFHAASITHNSTYVTKIIENHTGNSFVTFGGGQPSEEEESEESEDIDE